MPRETRTQRNKKIKIAQIRSKLVDMDQKILDYRKEQIDNRPYTGQDRHLRDMLLAYAKGHKRKQVTGEMQGPGGQFVKKKIGGSGGKLSKKDKHFKAQTEEFLANL
mmetsp:Transcript_10675/g.10548  ORF Transcript_10675/g.10548 Transcript_10675/m.10548 type:complete len:107 (-) Transcript_10675:28-348(-)